MTVTQLVRPNVLVRPSPARPLPQLENGDHLTRAEFERRWEAMPNLKKAELIEGKVYMAAAVRHKPHGRNHLILASWVGHYLSLTPGVDGSDNASVRIDQDNEVQPDVLLRIPEAVGGTSKVSLDDYLEGPPELVAEVSASTTSIDLHDKLHLYRRSGVREYLVWRVLDEAIDWFVAREGRFEPLPAAADGLLKSEAFPGLWLEPAALLRGDLARLFELLRQGAATPEHAALVQRLNPPAASEKR